jgi:hypothetical protein
MAAGSHEVRESGDLCRYLDCRLFPHPRSWSVLRVAETKHSATGGGKGTGLAVNDTQADWARSARGTDHSVTGKHYDSYYDCAWKSEADQSALCVGHVLHRGSQPQWRGWAMPSIVLQGTSPRRGMAAKEVNGCLARAKVSVRGYRFADARDQALEGRRAEVTCWGPNGPFVQTSAVAAGLLEFVAGVSATGKVT